MDKVLRGTSLAVTVDINNRFLLSWGNPTEDNNGDVVVGDNVETYDKLAGVVHIPERHDDRQWITMEGVETAYPSKDGTTLTLSFAGKNKAYVMMYAEIVPILLSYDIVRILKPMYFHQSRTGGRICVRRDGLEINLLTVLGNFLGISRPSWSTKNCWRENPSLVIGQSDKPVGGTREYMKAYYLRTTESRREAREEAKKAKALAHMEAKTRVDTIEDIIASLKGNGGGGPLTPTG